MTLVAMRGRRSSGSGWEFAATGIYPWAVVRQDAYIGRLSCRSTAGSGLRSALGPQRSPCRSFLWRLVRGSMCVVLPLCFRFDGGGRVSPGDETSGKKRRLDDRRLLGHFHFLWRRRFGGVAICSACSAGAVNCLIISVQISRSAGMACRVRLGGDLVPVCATFRRIPPRASACDNAAIVRRRARREMPPSCKP